MAWWQWFAVIYGAGAAVVAAATAVLRRTPARKVLAAAAIWPIVGYLLVDERRFQRRMWREFKARAEAKAKFAGLRK